MENRSTQNEGNEKKKESVDKSSLKWIAYADYCICPYCKFVSSSTYKFCPDCGRRLG